MNRILEVKNISKIYKMYQNNFDRLKELFLKKSYHKEFVANKDVSFELYEGETLGIIGVNGAGKSTILKMIAGVITPTSGEIIRHGRVTALLELGTGFNNEMSGYDNIYLNGMLIGMSNSDIDKSIDDIIEFSELGDYIYEPIKTYSSGMSMRLAFSISSHSNPQVLIIDEALSVGDAYFQQKSMRKIFELKNSGVSSIFVSHDINSIKMLCDTVLLLDSGNMVDIGEPKEIINFYQNMLLKKSHQGDIEYKQEKIGFKHKDNSSKNINHATTGEVELLNLVFKNSNNEEINYIVSEHILKISFTIKSSKYLDDPHYGIIIRNKYGVSAFETNTYTMRQKTDPLDKDKTMEIEFSFNCNLGIGDYSISIGVVNRGYDRGSFEEYLLFLQDIEMIKVIENGDSIKYGGYTNLKPLVNIKEINTNNNSFDVFNVQKEFIDIKKYSNYITYNGYSRPIMLIIETVNICNNNCIVCAYSELSRVKKIMSEEIFKKTLKDYNDIGGGALSLTPVVGDVFLDKKLVSRYKEILTYPFIKDISFTTNAVISSSFNNEDLKYILNHTTKIHISIYGTDKDEYLKMTKRDEYDKLISSIKRILSLVDDTKKIVFGFRSLKKYKIDFYEKWILDNFKQNISFASTNEFANWSVLDTKIALPFDATWSQNIKVKKQCLIPLVACQVFVDGEVSFCPCDDFDNNKELHLGSIQNKTLLEIYNTTKTKNLWDFNKKTPEFCKECSFYLPIDKIEENNFMFENPLKFIGG